MACGSIRKSDSGAQIRTPCILEGKAKHGVNFDSKSEIGKERRGHDPPNDLTSGIKIPSLILIVVSCLLFIVRFLSIFK